MTDTQGQQGLQQALASEVITAEELELYGSGLELARLVKETTLVGVIRLARELKTCPPGKPFMEAMKLWERMLMSMPTEKGKGAKRTSRKGDE